MSLMPMGATCVVYGAMTQERIRDVDALSFVFKNHKMKGFNFGEWIKQGIVSQLLILRSISKMIKSQLKTEVYKVFPLCNIHDAIECYKENMSKGKIVLKPFSDEE